MVLHLTRVKKTKEHADNEYSCNVNIFMGCMDMNSLVCPSGIVVGQRQDLATEVRPRSPSDLIIQMVMAGEESNTPRSIP